MNYHISTTIIYDNFKRHGECPLCDIYSEVETRVIEQFQGEAVMIDDFRDRVNRKGFCDKHFALLLRGDNKLGIALQAHTRLNYLLTHLPKAANVKTAAAAADDTEKQLTGCAVCDLIESSMNRYIETIPKLFANEEGFDGMFLRGKGFCLHHYAALLRRAKHAGGRKDDFIRILQRMERENLDRLLAELDGFCNKFDYRNADKPLGESATALIRTIAKIHGKR